MEVLNGKTGLLFLLLLLASNFACLNGKPKFDNLSDPFNYLTILIRLFAITDTAQLSTGNQESITLLSSGKVLITGGLGGNTAKVFNPSDKTFSATHNNMSKVRSNHSATLLQNGTVLVAGGYNGTDSLSEAELYDSSTNEFKAIGGMPSQVHDHTATLLLDGRVLLAEGQTLISKAFNPLNTAQLYDPATGSFTSTGNMSQKRFEHTATLLPNGKVLLTGGNDGTTNNNNNVTNATNTAELYDPATGSFTATGNLNKTRQKHTATLLQNGKVLIVGGLDNNGNSLNSAEVYDLSTGIFSSIGILNYSRDSHTATILQNGYVLIAGGDNQGQFQVTTELYNPSTGAFLSAANLNYPYSNHSAILLINEQVLIIEQNSSSSFVTEFYNSNTGVFIK